VRAPAAFEPETWLRLMRLLQSAPVLRFLRLGVEFDEPQLSALSSVGGLGGLRLSRPWWMPWRQRCFYSSRRHRLPQAEPTGWQPVHEADREFLLASSFRDDGALFRDDTERFHGRTGGEAFFAAVDARLASREVEVDDSGGDDEEDSEESQSLSEDEDDSDDDEDDIDNDEEEDKMEATERRWSR
jgi:hypothetical protein